MIKKPSKYRAVPTYVDGIRFASKAEANRYEELRTMVDAGAITKLRIQPRYSLDVDGVKLGEYRPDFDYMENGELKVEDVKGVRTEIFIWKKKHFQAQYKINLIEITRGGRVSAWTTMPDGLSKKQRREHFSESVKPVAAGETAQ